MAITEQTTLTLTMRPNAFAEVIGLEEAVRSIKNLLDSGSVPRAFLIKGQYGCGKTTLAHIIARYIQGPFFEGKTDIQEVNAANFRKIDDMRALAEQAGTYPMIGTYKVIIMDECQQMTKDAQQILLKELEVKSSPTVWILCTTDPHKINQGVQDRCFPVSVEGLNAGQRHELIARAAATVKRTAPFADLEEAITKAEISSPRKVLMAFEKYNSGVSAQSAVNEQRVQRDPEVFAIAMGVLYGNWDNKYNFGGVAMPSVSAQLKAMDDKLKNKQKKVVDAPGAEEPVAEDVVEDEELAMTGTRDEMAHALKIILTTLLKNQVIKGGPKSLKAAQALGVLATCVPEQPNGTGWAFIIGGLYRVYVALRAN